MPEVICSSAIGSGLDGRRIVITRHGQPIAELGPISHGDAAARRVALERMKTFHGRHRLKGETTDELIDAAYLELAIRRRLPLASLDRKLLAVGNAAGITVFP